MQLVAPWFGFNAGYRMECASTHPAGAPTCSCPGVGDRHTFMPRGTFALCWADSSCPSQVQPVACENSEDRSITRVDEGLEDFFAKRLITETLP